jgi:hypothetical protein
MLNSSSGAPRPRQVKKAAAEGFLLEVDIRIWFRRNRTHRRRGIHWNIANNIILRDAGSDRGGTMLSSKSPVAGSEPAGSDDAVAAQPLDIGGIHAKPFAKHFGSMLAQ